MSPVVKRSVGISIRGEQASFVELGKVLGRIRLLGSGVFPIPRADGPPPPGQPSGGGSGPVKATEPGSFPIRRRPDEVILGLPRRAIVLRSLELPAVENGDLAGLLAYEIDRHLPFPAEEAYYGFQRLSRQGEKAKVLLAAARKADVERHIARLECLGLRPTAVDVSAFAAANALLYTQRPENGTVLGLIQLEEGEAEVSLVRTGVLLSSRAVALEAGSFQPILREIQRTSEEGIEAPEKILVGGGDEEVCRQLSEALGRPVERWSPAPPSTDASTYGLALKGLVKLPLTIDLLPQDRQKDQQRAVAVMLALGILLAVLGGAWATTSAYRERKTLSLLNRRIEAVRAEAAEVEALKGDLATLKNQLQALEGVARQRGRTLLTLKELISLLPTDVALSDLSLEGNRLQIRGTTSGSAAELISALERSSGLENAAFTSPISSAGKDRQGFQLQAFVKADEQRSAVGPRPSAVRKRP